MQRALLLQTSHLCFNHCLEGMLLTGRGEQTRWQHFCAAASDGLHPFPLLWALGCVTVVEQPLMRDAPVAEFCLCKDVNWRTVNRERQYLGKITFQSCLFPIACKETLSLAEGSAGSRSVHPFLRVGSKTLMPKDDSLSKVTSCVKLYNFLRL